VQPYSVQPYRVPSPPAGHPFPKLKRHRPVRVISSMTSIAMGLAVYSTLAMGLCLAGCVAIDLKLQMPSGCMCLTPRAQWGQRTNGAQTEKEPKGAETLGLEWDR